MGKADPKGFIFSFFLDSYTTGGLFDDQHYGRAERCFDYRFYGRAEKCFDDRRYGRADRCIEE